MSLRFRVGLMADMTGVVPGHIVLAVTDTAIDTDEKTSDGVNTVSDFRMVPIEVEDVSTEDLESLTRQLCLMADDLQEAVALIECSPLVNPTRSQIATVELVPSEEVPEEFRSAGG